MASPAEFKFFRIVQQNAFLFDVREEVLPFGQADIDLLEVVVDDMDVGFYLYVVVDAGLDFFLQTGVVSVFLGTGNDEDVEIGFVFVGDVAFRVNIFDPVATGVAAKKNYHLNIGKFFADYFSNEQKLVSFLFRQMRKRFFHYEYYRVL